MITTVSRPLVAAATAILLLARNSGSRSGVCARKVSLAALRGTAEEDQEEEEGEKEGEELKNRVEGEIREMRQRVGLRERFDWMERGLVRVSSRTGQEQGIDEEEEVRGEDIRPLIAVTVGVTLFLLTRSPSAARTGGSMSGKGGGYGRQRKRERNILNIDALREFRMDMEGWGWDGWGWDGEKGHCNCYHSSPTMVYRYKCQSGVERYLFNQGRPSRNFGCAMVGESGGPTESISSGSKI